MLPRAGALLLALQPLRRQKFCSFGLFSKPNFPTHRKENIDEIFCHNRKSNTPSDGESDNSWGRKVCRNHPSHTYPRNLAKNHLCPAKGPSLRKAISLSRAVRRLGGQSVPWMVCLEKGRSLGRTQVMELDPSAGFPHSQVRHEWKGLHIVAAFVVLVDVQAFDFLVLGNSQTKHLVNQFQ